MGGAAPLSGIREKLRLFLAFLTSSKGIALLFLGGGCSRPSIILLSSTTSSHFSGPSLSRRRRLCYFWAQRLRRPSAPLSTRPYLHVWLCVRREGGRRREGGIGLLPFPLSFFPPLLLNLLSFQVPAAFSLSSSLSRLVHSLPSTRIAPRPNQGFFCPLSSSSCWKNFFLELCRFCSFYDGAPGGHFAVAARLKRRCQ